MPMHPPCVHCLRPARHGLVPHSNNIEGEYVVIYELSRAHIPVCSACLNALYTYCEREELYALNTLVTTIRCESALMNFTEHYAENNFEWDDDEEVWRTAESASMHLQPYDADPFNSFDWDSRNRPNALVFGVELEMEPHNGHTQQELIKALAPSRSIGKNFILKSDGSLSEGVELVTMPFTLAQHLDNSGVPWKTLLPKVYELAHSGSGTPNCGIHVHINKKALSALTIGKMLVFLNSPELSPLMSTIAQRPSSGYCRRSAKKLTDGTRPSESRYDMMNVSVRHPTCEVRMFRGNVTVERVYKNIEFCHALVQYCRQSSMRTLADWGNFSRWLIAQRGQYKHLVNFLIDSQTVGFRQLAKDRKDSYIKVIDR